MARGVLLLLLAAVVTFGLLTLATPPAPADREASAQSDTVVNQDAAVPAAEKPDTAGIAAPDQAPAASAERTEARDALAAIAAETTAAAFVTPHPAVPLAEQIAVATRHAAVGDPDAAHFLARIARRCQALMGPELMLPNLPPSDHTRQQREQCQELGEDWRSGLALQRWMERAVELNHPVAVVEFLNQVPDMLGGADGVLANLDRALELRERGRFHLERAAAQGNPMAWQTLAWMLAQDTILGPADPVRALAYQLALERHPDGAAQDPIYRTTLMAGLSPSDQARADALAAQLLQRCCPGR